MTFSEWRFLLASAYVCCEVTHHRGCDLLRESACVCCEITHDRGYELLPALARVCSKISIQKEYDVFVAPGCVVKHSAQKLRCFRGIGVCIWEITYQTEFLVCYRYRLVHVVGSHITGGSVCDWHPRVYVARSHGVRYVTGTGVCML